MNATNERLRAHVAILIVFFSAALFLLPSCGGSTTEPRAEDELAPFKEMARKSECADLRNRLFLVDGHLVFWDRAGNCPDAAYAQTLFGSTVDDLLCTFHDSISGPIKTCRDERDREMFDTMIANLDKPDLGLGSDHTVQPIPF